MLQANKLFCWKLKQLSKFSVALVAPCLGPKSGTGVLSSSQTRAVSHYFEKQILIKWGKYLKIVV